MRVSLRSAPHVQTRFSRKEKLEHESTQTLIRTRYDHRLWQAHLRSTARRPATSSAAVTVASTVVFIPIEPLSRTIPDWRNVSPLQP